MKSWLHHVIWLTQRFKEWLAVTTVTTVIVADDLEEAVKNYSNTVQEFMKEAQSVNHKEYVFYSGF